MTAELASPDSVITIERLDDEHELLCHYPQQSAPQPCYVWLDTETGRMGAAYNAEIGNAVPFRVWHGIQRRWSIPALTADSANTLLETLRPLAERIYRGSETVWDGHNNVARLDDDARAADVEADALCEDMFSCEDSIIQSWDAREWLVDAPPDLTRCTPDSQLAGIVEALDAEARADGVALERTEQAVREWRARLRTEAAEEHEDVEETGVAECARSLLTDDCCSSLASVPVVFVLPQNRDTATRAGVRIEERGHVCHSCAREILSDQAWAAELDAGWIDL